jgi:hypothetical protein
VIEQKVTTITPATPLAAVANALTTSPVVVVVDVNESNPEVHPTDILTKIDLLSYLASSPN